MSNFYTTVCVAWDGDPPTPPPRAIGLFPCCSCHRDNLGKVFCICTPQPTQLIFPRLFMVILRATTMVRRHDLDIPSVLSM